MFVCVDTGGVQMVHTHAAIQGEEKPETVRKAIRNVLRTQGPRGFYRGLGTAVIRVLPSTCITFVVYETFMDYTKE